MEIFCGGHPLRAVRPVLLQEVGASPSGRIKKTPSGRLVRFCGMLVLVHTPPTRSGRRVMFVTLEDEDGLFDLVAFPGVQSSAAGLLLTSTVITGEGLIKRRGRGTSSYSVVIRRLFPDWCGSIPGIFAHASALKAERGAQGTYFKPGSSDVEKNSNI